MPTEIRSNKQAEVALHTTVTYETLMLQNSASNRNAQGP